MRTGSIIRHKAKSGDAGTFSDLVVMAKGVPEASPAAIALQLVLGELPPRANQHGLSCLPPMLDEGAITYLLKYEYSSAHKKNNYRFVGVIHADGSIGPVPGGRTAAEIHAANLMGDILKALGAQVEGCGAPGLSFAVFPKGSEFHSFTAASPEKLVLVTLAQDQPGVAASGTALAALEKELAGEDLALTVAWI